MTQPSSPAHTFRGLGIAPNILERLDAIGFTTPTPIQHASIPAGVEGKDVIGIAQTGTGKTLAFGIPMMQKVLAQGTHGLVVLPTRELALQVDETFQQVGKALGLRTAVLIGGASMHIQKQMIKNRPHVVIATPGRLLDHLEQRTITLKTVETLVLDEADRMLDMGFAPQINKILEAVPRNRQTMLFSATMPGEIVKIATKHMKLPIRVEVAPAGTAAERVEQEIFIVPKDRKVTLLESLLKEYKGSVLVFTRTKYGAKKIARTVRVMGHSSAEIHGNRTQAQRKDALDGFKSGKYRVLVATDIAARGIDVTGIEVVINYDLPNDPEDYVHRIGRTGRAGREGRAISFAEPQQHDDVRAIERLIRLQIPRKSTAHLPASATADEARRSGEAVDRDPEPHARQPRPERRRGNAPRQRGNWRRGR